MTSKHSSSSRGRVQLGDIPTFQSMDGSARADLLDEVKSLLGNIKEGTITKGEMVAALGLGDLLPRGRDIEEKVAEDKYCPCLAAILQDAAASANGASPLDVIIEPPLSDVPTTLLLYSAFHANVDIVSMLLDNGADATFAPACSMRQGLGTSSGSAITEPLSTPLHGAIAGAMHDAGWVGDVAALPKRGELRIQMINILMEKGADPYARNSNGHYPLELLDDKVATSEAEGRRLKKLKTLMVEAVFPKISPGAVGLTGALDGECGEGYSGASEEQLPILMVCEDKNAVGELREAIAHDKTIATTTYPVPGEEVAETTALYTAALAGNHEGVGILLEHGADVNFQTREGNTALHAACFNGHSHVVWEIASQLDNLDLKGRPNLELRNRNGEKCIDAFAEGVPEKTREEIKAMLRGTLGTAGLLKAAKGEGKNPLDLLREHLEHPATNIDTEYDASILDHQAKKAYQPTAEKVKASSSLFSKAFAAGRSVMTTLATMRGKKRSKKNDPVTLCTYAARHGYDSGVSLLLDAGASIDTPQDEAKSALMEAATNNHLTTARLLLDAGADPGQDLELLDRSSRLSSEMQVMLEEVMRGAKVATEEVEVQEQINVLETKLAAMLPREAAMEVVEQESAPLSRLIEWIGTELSDGQNPADTRYPWISEDGVETTTTLLYRACEIERDDCVELLLQHGADTSVPCGAEQSTALHEAVCRGYTSCVQLLLSAGADTAYYNSSGDQPGDRFDDNVSPLVIREIQSLLQNAKEAAMEERRLGRRKRLADFVRTLPKRLIDQNDATGASIANRELDRVFSRAFERNGELCDSFTEDVMLTALTAILTALLEGKPGTVGDPVSRMFRAALTVQGPKCAAAAVRVVDIDEWYKVPMPSLFPTAVIEYVTRGKKVNGIATMVGAVHTATAKDLIKPLCDESGLFSMCPPLAEALQEFVSFYKPSPIQNSEEREAANFVEDVAIRIRELSCDLIENAAGLRVQNPLFAKGVSNGALLNTCVEEVVLPALLEEFDTARSLFPRPGLLRSAVSGSNPRAIIERALVCANACDVSQGCVWKFIKNIAVPSFGPSDLYEDGANVAKEYLSRAQQLVEKQKKNPTSALLALDGLAIRMLYRRPVEAVKEWMQRGDWAQKPLTTPADTQLHIICNEYSQFITTTLCREAVTKYRDPTARMARTKGKHELCSLPPWKPEVFKDYLMNTNLLRTFAITFAKRSKPNDAKSAASWDTFTNFITNQLLSAFIENRLLNREPASFHIVILRFLRPLALNFAWAHLPAYNKLNQVHYAIRENDVVLIEASTGCGKSTVIPQALSLSFVQEAADFTEHNVGWNASIVGELWPGLDGIPFSEGGLRNNSGIARGMPSLPQVIVTQPRREPARSVASNVATVYGQRRVGHQIGGTQNPNPGAELQYFTDALFLGRVLSHETFAGVAAVVIDEVHERSASIDLLYQTLLLRQQALRAAGKRAFKIILASATVDPKWFQSAASLPNRIGNSSFKSSFAHVDMLVKSPHHTTNTTPRTGTLKFCTDQKERKRQMKPGGPANGQLNGPTRAQLAAREAFEIISDGAVSNGGQPPKVLVFMPHVKEINDAKAIFDSISGGAVVSGALHAKTRHPRNILASSRVIFANNVAETSITVPDLTHVLDLNLSVTQTADGPDSWVELSVGPSTQSSLAQRRGRVGRTSDGTYIPFYCPVTVTSPGTGGTAVDVTELPTCFRPQAENLPNEDLAQMEMRVQYYLGRSMFENSEDLPTIGEGLKMRWLDCEETVPLTQHIPYDVKTLQQAAVLNLTAGLALALEFATKKKTCPLAIAWISAIMQAREAPLPFNARVPQKFALGNLGHLGDFGMLLEVMKDFFLEREAHTRNVGGGIVLTAEQSEKFAEDYARNNAPLNGTWLRIVAERIDTIRPLCAAALPDCNPFLIGGSPDQWDAKDIEEALCVGYWRHAFRLVESPTLKLADSFGPYRSIDPAQLSKVRLTTGGPWTASTSTLPKWLLCYRLQRFGDPPFLYSAQSVIPVSEETLRGVMAQHAPDVAQTVALLWSQYNPAKGRLEDVTKPSWHAGVQVSMIKKEGKTDPGFCDGTKRRNSSFMNYYCEYRFSGGRVGVANAIENFCEIIKQALAAEQLALLPTTQQEGFTLPAPNPVTPQQLQSIWPKCFIRFKESVSPRTDAEIHAALHSDRRSAGRALMNVLVNKWGIRPKGGPVRDLVVLDKDVNDIDANAPPQKVQRGKENDFVENVKQDLNKRFQCLCTTTGTRANNEGITFTVKPSGPSWPAIEVDIIFEHCARLYQHNDSDFTCNNLWLTPNSHTVGLEQKLSCFGIPTAAILQEMLAGPKPRTTVLKEVSWGKVPRGETPEGRAQNVYAKGMNRMMQKRIDKTRRKAFWLLEIPPQIKGDYITLYHGCSKDAAKAIKSGMFKPGSCGNLGPGVYMSRDVAFCRYYSTGGLLQAEVHVGRKVDVNGFVGSSWYKDQCTGSEENDTAFLSKAKSPRSSEEWCIRNPATRKLVEIRNIRDYP